MNIELKEIDKDTLKVGDIVGVARGIQCGWRWFRHSKSLCGSDSSLAEDFRKAQRVITSA